MRFPARFSHLATRSVVVTKLAPMCARALDVDEDIAASRLDAGLKGPLLEELLGACWDQLQAAPEKPTDEALLEQVATAMRKRGSKPGRDTSVTPGWTAFLLLVDVRAGTTGDAARRILESDEGKKRVAKGLTEVAK